MTRQSARDSTAIDRSGIVTGHHSVVKREVARRLRSEMTPSELRLWERLRANRLLGLQFRRQQIIDGFIVDFYCHSAGLVVEVDGGVHLHQREYDAERQAIIERRGLRLIRFTNDQVENDIEYVVATIADAIR